MKTTVIFTTYNQPAWLEKVLWGFFEQSRKDFEIVIADDGSTMETAQLIERMRAESSVSIRHVWQPDDGFQKCRILNKAIVESAGDYLIFTDGDCIPRDDFIEQHIHHAAPNQYLSGGYFKLPMDISKAINRDDVRHQRPFSPAWLKAQGMKVGLRGLKISARGFTSLVLNQVIPVKATWNGHNSSCFKELIYRVNGFNELMQYGGQDVEFGLRLKHIGVQPKRIRFSTIGVHLDHSRGYVTEAMRENSAKEIRKTLDEKRKSSPLGIDQYQKF